MIRFLRNFIMLSCLNILVGMASTNETPAMNIDNPNKVPGTNLDQKYLEMKIIKKSQPSRLLDQLLKEIFELNSYIGSYPPNFTSEAERETIYRKWLDLLSDAEAISASAPKDEKVLYALAELYRQGHNLDVKDSAERAVSTLDACFALYPLSVMCNMSAAYLYLFVGPEYIDRAAKSLSILREHFAPKLNSQVERLYIFLYMMQRNEKMVRNQIDKFIKNFPNSPDIAMFRKMRGAKLK